MNLDPAVHRVLQRYLSVVFGANTKTTLSVEYTTTGTISADDIARLLKPSFGNLHRLTFRPSLTGFNTVAFEAVNVRGELVEGRVVLHAVIADNVIRSWAEVMVDAVDGAIPF